MIQWQLRVRQFPQYSAVERRLINSAEALRKISPGTHLKVMTRGWCTTKLNYAQCPSADLEGIKDLFLSEIPAAHYDLFFWFNILDPGGTIGNHNHHLADFSMAYHIKGGSALLIDLGTRSEILPPAPGRMAIFPATVYHAVPQPAIEKRYSLSFNAHLRK